MVAAAPALRGDSAPPVAAATKAADPPLSTSRRDRVGPVGMVVPSLPTVLRPRLFLDCIRTGSGRAPGRNVPVRSAVRSGRRRAPAGGGDPPAPQPAPSDQPGLRPTIAACPRSRQEPLPPALAPPDR